MTEYLARAPHPTVAATHNAHKTAFVPRIDRRMTKPPRRGGFQSKTAAIYAIPYFFVLTGLSRKPYIPSVVLSVLQEGDDERL
jgi:hypothetical protein